MTASPALDYILTDVIAQNERPIVASYVETQQNTRSAQLMSTEDLRRQCGLLVDQLRRGTSYNAQDSSFDALRQTLREISRTRALQGFSPSETAKFVFSLKEVLIPYLNTVFEEQPVLLGQQILATNQLLDAFGLLTFDIYVQSREELIREQSRAILELSTPVVQLWEGILALPIIGSVDTARTQQIMESLLNRIIETGSSMVIIDITGVAVVDTAVAQHLLQTVSAARLLGAETVIVGISSRIAQTLVHLGVDLSEVVTRASMAKGLEYALIRTNQRIIRVGDHLSRAFDYNTTEVDQGG